MCLQRLAALCALVAAGCGAGRTAPIALQLPFAGPIDSACVRLAIQDAPGIGSVQVTNVPASTAGDHLLQYVARDDSLATTLVVDQRMTLNGDHLLLAGYAVPSEDSTDVSIGRFRRATQELLDRIERNCGVERIR